MPYGIIQRCCYLQASPVHPAAVTFRAFTPAEAGTGIIDPGGIDSIIRVEPYSVNTRAGSVV